MVIELNGLMSPIYFREYLKLFSRTRTCLSPVFTCIEEYEIVVLEKLVIKVVLNKPVHHGTVSSSRDKVGFVTQYGMGALHVS